VSGERPGERAPALAVDYHPPRPASVGPRASGLPTSPGAPLEGLAVRSADSWRSHGVRRLLVRKARERIRAEEHSMLFILLQCGIGAVAIGTGFLVQPLDKVPLVLWVVCWGVAARLLHGRSPEERLLLCWWFAWAEVFLNLALLLAAATCSLAGMEGVGPAVGCAVLGWTSGLIVVLVTQVYQRMAQLEGR